MTEKIGQMDEGYFVPRSDIVRWINHTLQLEMTEVEQLGTGAIYCQLFDSLYPGRVPMGKINWRAKQEYEFIQNFKLLQSVLDRVGIDKKIEVALFSYLGPQTREVQVPGQPGTHPVGQEVHRAPGRARRALRCCWPQGEGLCLAPFYRQLQAQSNRQ